MEGDSEHKHQNMVEDWVTKTKEAWDKKFHHEEAEPDTKRFKWMKNLFRKKPKTPTDRQEDRQEESKSFSFGTSSSRKLTSRRSFKSKMSFDNPELLAAWSGNPVVYIDSGEYVEYERLQSGKSDQYFAEEFKHLEANKDVEDALLPEGEEEDEEDYEEFDVPEMRLKLIYFFFCFAFSIYSPFFVLYMKNNVKLSAGQIGLVSAMQIVGGYVVGPPSSIIVDNLRIHKWVWIGSMILCIIPVQLIPMIRNFGSAIGVALGIAMVNAPMSSILDSSCLVFLGPRSHDYGKIRFWGAIGWGLGSLVGGSLVQFFGTSSAFHLFAVCMVINVGVVISLDFTRIHQKKIVSQEGKFLSFWQSLAELIPDWHYAFFLFVAIVAGFGATSLQSLLLMFLSDLGAPDFLEGLTLSVATISELPIFYASGAIIKRYGASSLLCAAMVAFTVRSLLVSFIVNPWFVLPLQLLHGFTFAGAWTAGVSLAKDYSPEGLETTGQSIFSMAYNGLGGLSGSIVGGQLYDIIGPRNMYRTKSVIFAITVVLYAISLKDWRRLLFRKDASSYGPI